MAVTGLGVISAVGSDRASFWDSLVHGRHGFREITLADTSDLQYRMGAEVHGVAVADRFDAGARELLDRFAMLFLIAAREAIADSGLETTELREAAIVTGSSLGGQSTEDELFRSLYQEGRRRITPFAVPKTMANAGASHLSMEIGCEGPGFTLASACASSTHAIGLACWMVRQGVVERAIAGGSEAPFSRGHLKAWDSLRAISPDLPRPFSLGRRGMVLGEGGGALLLESLESARRRGAHVRALLLGFGMSSDASHITKPSSRGAARALSAALADGALDRERVGYVNAHGTGTPLNDVAEWDALREVFGERASRLPVSSTKSMHGHTLGASGALEAAATVLALENRVLPPTANFLEPDPECPLDCVPNEARDGAAGVALSSSFAFGGLNAVLAFGRSSP
ncbi:MAG TPA: beta-ketoacyl-[acyl-carrier-protein] synthase family protein [Vicinamibacteria bacterium]|nr:beta-ketoacyl-[acyl-carrier-protein] synthase family protein [Vicinamibacteria bacterium]